MNDRTCTFRERYRRDVVPQAYRGLRHALGILLCAGALVAAPWLMFELAIEPVSVAVTAACTLIVASVVEYLAHRHVMHRPVPGLRAVYQRHARQHHRYYTRGDFVIRDAKDLHATLFPFLLLGFFALVTLGLGVGIAFACSLPVAAVFFSTCIGYYVLYELVHLSAHLPPSGRARPRWLRALNALHQLHHEPHLMRRANFNIVLPLADLLFGTLRYTRVPPVAVTAPQSDRPFPDAEHLLRVLERD